MGILGNLAGNLADMALDAIQNASLQNAVMAGIVFRHDHFSYTSIRNNIVQGILGALGLYIGVNISAKNRGKAWDVYLADTDEEKAWDAFVLTNGDVVIKYGLYGMANCGIEISGANAGILAQKTVPILEEFDCYNIQYVTEKIPFHQDSWMNSVESYLEGDTSDEDLKKFLKSQGLKKHGDIFIKGDLKDFDALICKWNEIFEKNSNLENITTHLFDKTKLYFDEKMSNEQDALIFTDGESAISYKDNLLGYFKKNPNKSLIFQYVEDIDYSYMQMLFTDETISGSLESIVLVPENIEISDFEIFLESIEDSGIEVPCSFSDYFNNFKETLRILEEALKSNEKTKSGSDDLGDFLDNLTDKLENAFNVLELDEDEEDTTLEDVKKAYRNLSKEFHPDKMSGLTPKMRQIAEEKMQELNEAYEFLCKYFEMTDSDDDIGD